MVTREAETTAPNPAQELKGTPMSLIPHFVLLSHVVCCRINDMQFNYLRNQLDEKLSQEALVRRELMLRSRIHRLPEQETLGPTLSFDIPSS
jgi:hypothetical protein